jgi:hypothetical protein
VVPPPHAPAGAGGGADAGGRTDALLSLHKACVRADRTRSGQLEWSELSEVLARHRVECPPELRPAAGSSVKYGPLVDKLRAMHIAPSY